MSLTKVSYSMITGAPVNVLDFGATGNGSTDDTTSINAAITYAGSNGGGNIFFPAGTYKISSPLVLINSQSLVGNGNTTIYNVSTTQEAITAGQNPSSYNGNMSYISGINFTGNTSGNSSCHGILIQGETVFVSNCTFSNFKGSGIKGTYCQYTRINNCGFSNNGRYGIEILTNNVNTQGSNDIDIADVYQNIGNGLGGIYAQMQQCTIRRCTFTGSTSNNYQLSLIGFNNLVEQCTFELSQSGITNQTSCYVLTQNDAPQTFFNCIWESSTNARSVLIDTNSSDVIFDTCTFNYTAGTISNAGYVLKISQETNVYVRNCAFTNLLSATNTGGYLPVGCSAGAYNIFYESPFKYQLTGLTSTSGTSPYFFAYPSVQLYAYGTYQINMFTGGNNGDYQNHPGVCLGNVYFYSGLQAFDNGTVHSAGNQHATGISAINSSGLVTITASNDFSGTQSFTLTTTQVGFPN